MDPLGRYAIAIEGEGYSQRYWVIDTQESTDLTPWYVPISKHKNIRTAAGEVRRLNRMEKEAALRRAMVQANLASREGRDA